LNELKLILKGLTRKIYEDSEEANEVSEEAHELC